MLPILAVREQIVAHLNSGNRLVLAAPTGSGKSTQTPQILLRDQVAAGQILVLQPRRLATRMVARRVAQELGTPIGGLVGYQTRNDSKISRQSRIRFITDGLFTRLLRESPTLDRVDAVIVDEFHERSLAADLTVALVCRLQEEARPDLKLLVMSATLDATAIADRLQCPPLQTSERLHPIDVHYRSGSAPIWERAADALIELLGVEKGGDILVFMPGAYEIRRSIEAMHKALRRASAAEQLAFFPLHGSLPPRQQDAAGPR